MESAPQCQSRRKIDSLTRLAVGIAEEFNNVLTAIRAYTQLSLHELDRPDLVDNLRGIERVGSQADELLQVLLTFGGESSFRHAEVSVERLLAAERQNLERVIGSDTRVHWEVAPGTPLVLADHTQLVALLTHVLRNASEAIGPSGGELRITAEPVGPHGLPVTPPLAGSAPEQMPHVCLRISDSGCGIAPADREHVMDPFFTTKAGHRGLGLALASGILRAHGGACFIEPAQPAGTCVTLLLPASTPDASPSPTVASATAIASHSTPSDW